MESLRLCQQIFILLLPPSTYAHAQLYKANEQREKVGKATSKVYKKTLQYTHI